VNTYTTPHVNIHVWSCIIDHFIYGVMHGIHDHVMSSICKKCLKAIKRERVVVTNYGTIACICDRKSSRELYHKTKEAFRSKDVSLKRYGSIDSIIDHIRIGDLAAVKEMASMYNETQGYIVAKIFFYAVEYDQPDIITEFYTQYCNDVDRVCLEENEQDARDFNERDDGMIAAIIRALVLGNRRVFDLFYTTTKIMRYNAEMIVYAAVKDGTYKTLDILTEYENGWFNGHVEACAFYGYVDFLRYVLNATGTRSDDIYVAIKEAARGNQPRVLYFLRDEHSKLFGAFLDIVFAHEQFSTDVAIMLHDEFGATRVHDCMVSAFSDGNYELVVMCHDVWGAVCDEEFIHEVVQSHYDCRSMGLTYIDKLREWGADTNTIVKFATHYGDNVILDYIKGWV